MATESNESVSSQSAQAEQTGIAKIDESTQGIMRELMGQGALPTLHNFKGTPQEVWRETTLATGPDVMSVDDLKGESFPIRNFFVQAVLIRDAGTGKQIPRVRCVLISPDGRRLACVSDGVAKDLAGIIHTFGIEPYEPPVEVFVTEVRTRSGFKVYRIIPA